MVRKLFPALLMTLVILSLGINLYLLVTVMAMRTQLLAVGAVAGPVIETVALDLEHAASETINLVIPVQKNIPISTTITLDDTFEVPIKLNVPIKTIITIPLDLGLLGPQRLSVPIDTMVPIDMSVPIELHRDVPFRTTIPLDISVPINIAIEDTLC